MSDYPVLDDLIEHDGAIYLAISCSSEGAVYAVTTIDDNFDEIADYSGRRDLTGELLDEAQSYANEHFVDAHYALEYPPQANGDGAPTNVGIPEDDSPELPVAPADMETLLGDEAHKRWQEEG